MLAYCAAGVVGREVGVPPAAAATAAAEAGSHEQRGKAREAARQRQADEDRGGRSGAEWRPSWQSL